MNVNTDIKQVIVMRNDLNMRKGKMCAQAAHASIQFMKNLVMCDVGPSRIEIDWLDYGMTKICVRVDSEAELMDIFNQAKEAKLTVHLVTDAGLTEFKEPTITCLAIGPNRAEDINKITGKLTLL